MKKITNTHLPVFEHLSFLSQSIQTQFSSNKMDWIATSSIKS